MITDKVTIHQSFRASPRDIEFKSLEENGPLTICLQIRSEYMTRLIIVNFQACLRYSVTPYKQRRSTVHDIEEEPWIMALGPQHMIVTKDRIVEITSGSTPSIRVVGSKT